MKLDFVAEVGSTWWQADSTAARCLALEAVTQAAEAGATVVKFQMFRADSLYSAIRAPKLRQRSKQYELPLDWLPDLLRAAWQQGIEIWYSVFDPELVAQVAPYADGLKLASGDLTYMPLRRELAAVAEEYVLPLIISTGMATDNEIRHALGDIRDLYNPEIYLLNCVSVYPAAEKDYELRSILLAGEGITRHGLSDHTMGCLVAQISTGLDYTIFEKHFMPWGAADTPDAAVALNPQEFKRYVESVTLARQIVGGYHKNSRVSEQIDLLWARRGKDGLRPTDGVKEND